MTTVDQLDQPGVLTWTAAPAVLDEEYVGKHRHPQALRRFSLRGMFYAARHVARGRARGR